MASRTIISGYIAVPNGSEVRNEALIAAFPFDPVYALTNVFSRPRRGFAESLLSFAAAIKAAPEEWPEWRERFEQLLGVLECNTARALFEFDDGDAAAEFSYVFSVFATGAEPLEPVPGGRPCTRFLKEPGSSYSEEVELCL